jgi:hypothetical protein
MSERKLQSWMRREQALIWDAVAAMSLMAVGGVALPSTSMSTITGKNRITICGRRLTPQPYPFNWPQPVCPLMRTRVLKNSKERMPYRLFVPDVA